MGNIESRVAYLRSQALQIKPKLGLVLSKYERYGNRMALAHDLWKDYDLKVRDILRACGDDHLGKIACAGPLKTRPETNLVEVRGVATSLRFDEVLSGYSMVLEIATVAIIAALTDLVWVEMHKAIIVRDYPDLPPAQTIPQ